MTIKPRAPATVYDLYRSEGKAELVKGRLLREPPTGFGPNQSALEITIRLREHQRQFGGGVAVADNCGFLVDLPERNSFSRDAAWFTGPTTGMKFLEGAPAFAVEVRSENDYGPDAERRMAQKRQDYFAAGTLVVWDVDLLGADVVQAYAAEKSETPRIFRRGEMADAEPAVPGWRMAVDSIFP